MKARAATNRRCIFFDRLGVPAFGQKSKALLQGLVLKKKQSLLQGQVHKATFARPFCRAWCFFFTGAQRQQQPKTCSLALPPLPCLPVLAFGFWGFFFHSFCGVCSSFLVSSEELLVSLEEDLELLLLLLRFSLPWCPAMPQIVNSMPPFLVAYKK